MGSWDQTFLQSYHLGWQMVLFHQEQFTGKLWNGSKKMEVKTNIQSISSQNFFGETFGTIGPTSSATQFSTNTVTLLDLRLNLGEWTRKSSDFGEKVKLVCQSLTLSWETWNRQGLFQTEQDRWQQVTFVLILSKTGGMELIISSRLWLIMMSTQTPVGGMLLEEWALEKYWTSIKSNSHKITTRWACTSKLGAQS